MAGYYSVAVLAYSPRLARHSDDMEPGQPQATLQNHTTMGFCTPQDSLENMDVKHTKIHIYL